MRRTRAAVAEDRIDDGVSRDELAGELVVGHVIDRDAAVDRHLKERRELMSTRLARAIHRARQDHPNRCAAIDEMTGGGQPATTIVARPDGYVAWVGDLTQLGLADALTTWFGPPTAA